MGGGEPDGIECLLVDDHLSVLDALQDLLEAEGIVVVGRALTGAEALAFAPEHATVVVTDLRLPDISGMEVARELLRMQPGRAVVLYSATIGAVGAAAAVAIGVRGVVLKESVSRELPVAIRTVAGGGTYLDPRLG